MKIVWQVQAEIELDAAIDYYHLQASTTVAADFRNEVERVIKLLCKHTKLGA
jgi:plasmid stabilization system protein ParE